MVALDRDLVVAVRGHAAEAVVRHGRRAAGVGRSRRVRDGGRRQRRHGRGHDVTRGLEGAGTQEPKQPERPATVGAPGRRRQRCQVLGDHVVLGRRGHEDAPERAAVALEVDARGRPQHPEHVGREQVAPPGEHAAGPVDHPGLVGCVNRGEDALVELLQVAGGAVIEHDQIHHHAAPAPVVVRREQLPQRGQAFGRIDRGEHDGPITRDGRRPQHRLRAAVPAQLFLGGAQGRVGEEEMPGQLLEHPGVAGRDAELAQLDLGRSPGEVQRALGRTRMVIAIGELEGPLRRGGDEGGECHRRCLARLQPDPGAEREDRIEDGAGRAREPPVSLQRDRIPGRAAAADEPPAVGLARPEPTRSSPASTTCTHQTAAPAPSAGVASP